MVLLTLCAQALLTFAVEGEGPVRFGFPLPQAALREGLRVVPADAQLQWRVLQAEADPETERQWVELCVVAPPGRVRLLAGGAAAAGEAGGAVVAFARTEPEPGLVREEWRWGGGEVDWHERELLAQATTREGEAFAAGEALSRWSGGFADRTLRARIPRAAWAAAGVVPVPTPRRAALREHLVRTAEQLPELPGRRGRGDYLRSGGVVTNLEFDTALGFVRLGLTEQQPALLRRAWHAARHLVDHDLQRSTGLPHCHGKDHRSAPPETGHVWLHGTLLTGCVFADRGLVGAARSMALGLARHPPRTAAQDPRDDRARKLGWPLLELEQFLRFEPHPVVVRAADRLAAELRRRWDARDRVVRFGEGARRKGFYEERLWLTGGIVLPALRAHVRRREDGELRGIVAALERRLLEVILQGKPGLPVRCWVKDGRVTGQVRLRAVPEGALLLEGLSERVRARCLARKGVQRALAGVPDEEHADRATHWSMVARCRWVLR